MASSTTPDTATAKSPTKASIDPLVLQNRIAVTLARKRKLVASWLPPPTPEELAQAKSAEEIAAREEELWKPRPPTLGVGHPIPSSHTATETYNRENDLLRRRLLGPNAGKDARQRHLERTQLQYRAHDSDDASSDEDEQEQISRVTVSSSKKKKKAKRRKIKDEDGDDSGGKDGGEVTFDKATVADEEPGSTGGFVSLPVKQTPSDKKQKKKKQKNKESIKVEQPESDEGPDEEPSAASTKEKPETKLSLGARESQSPGLFPPSGSQSDYCYKALELSR
ncbi:hypothetical protein ABW21_db0207239 [Orbilia brochopaga]|nr:hypothetical protein ABW21_db0207239 [Drechslerella brochopaga]